MKTQKFIELVERHNDLLSQFWLFFGFAVGMAVMSFVLADTIFQLHCIGASILFLLLITGILIELVGVKRELKK